MPEQVSNKIKRFFVYTTRFAVFAAPGAFTQNVTVDASAPFFVANITVVEMAAAPTLWGYQLQISDSRASEVWINNPIAVHALAGNGTLPYPMVVARVLPASTTLSVILERLAAGAGAGAIEVSFHGWKLLG